MKNHRIKTKLLLKSQTIRRLHASNLQVVQGGLIPAMTYEKTCETAGPCAFTNQQVSLCVCV